MSSERETKRQASCEMDEFRTMMQATSISKKKLCDALDELNIFPGVITNLVAEYLEHWQCLKNRFLVPNKSVSEIGFINKGGCESTMMYTWDHRTGDLIWWDIASGTEKIRCLLPGGCADVLNKVSPDGTFIAHTDRHDARRLFVWRMNVIEAIVTRLVLDDQYTSKIASMSFSPDSSWIAVGYENGITKVWKRTWGNLPTWNCECQLRSDVSKESVFHPQKNYLISYNRPRLSCCDLSVSSHKKEEEHGSMVENLYEFINGIPASTAAQQLIHAISPCERFMTTSTLGKNQSTTMWLVRKSQDDLSIEQCARYPGVVYSAFSHDGLLFAVLHESMMSLYQRSYGGLEDSFGERMPIRVSNRKPSKCLLQ